MNYDLKPCPFCGDKPIRLFSMGDAPDLAHCPGCGVERMDVALWEDRPAPKLPEGYREEVDERKSELYVEWSRHPLATMSHEGFLSLGGPLRAEHHRALVAWLDIKGDE